MAKLQLKGFITSPPVVRQKKDFQTKLPVTDQQGNPVMERFFSVLDIESDETDIFKIKFSADQEEQVTALARQNVLLSATVGLFNKFTFYTLDAIKAS